MSRDDEPVRVLEADPGLGENLTAEQLPAARRRVLAIANRLSTGPWRVDVDRVPTAGFLVLEGCITRNVELLGQLRRSSSSRREIWCAPPPVRKQRRSPQVTWQILEPTLLAVLDRNFLLVAQPWPEVAAQLLQRQEHRAQWLASILAISHLPGVDLRILALFWQFADRWGRVSAGGASVPIPLTRLNIARLVGACRPTVTTALNDLIGDGVLIQGAIGTGCCAGSRRASSAARVLERLCSVVAGMSVVADRPGSLIRHRRRRFRATGQPDDMLRRPDCGGPITRADSSKSGHGWLILSVVGGPLACPQPRETGMNGMDVVRDAALVGIAGFGASKVMSKATTFMYSQQTDEAKQQEEEVSYGVAYNVAAKKTAALVGKELSDDEASKGGMALHYALALGWVPVYMVLRRRAGMSPFGAGAAAGLSMAVIIDEVANPLLGFTPPPQAYPLVTHLRGFAGHLVYGLAVAAFVEAGWKATGRR